MKLRFILLLLSFGFIVTPPILAKETKDVLYRFKNSEPVTFSHDFHLNKYSNNCRICHNAIFNLRDRRRYTMAEMEKTKSCGACHSGIKAFSVADEKACTNCHRGKPRTITYRVKGATEAVFSHETHITKTGGKCRGCHNGKIITGKEKNVSMAQMEKGRTCGACHDGKRSFSVAGNCGNCHKGMKPKDILFKVKGINDVTFSHTMHLGMYACKDCHTGIFTYKSGNKRYSMDEMGKGKSCGACHNGKDAFSSGSDCAKCHKSFSPGTISFSTDSGEAKFSHEIHLGMYKCLECHTKLFPYKSGVQHFGMGAMEGGKSCGACHNGKDAFSVKDKCDKCHKM